MSHCLISCFYRSIALTSLALLVAFNAVSPQRSYAAEDSTGGEEHDSLPRYAPLETGDFTAALESPEWQEDSVHGLQQSTTVLADPPRRDENIEQSQAFLPLLGAATAPLSLNGFGRRSQSRNDNVRAGITLGLASVPYMIGDTSAGTCFSTRGLLDADIQHPTLSCSRLNISENNTALPVDRFYYSYRHFNNATTLRVYQFEEQFDFDRYTLGYEKTFFDGLTSLEVRLPIEHRLRSDILSLVTPSFGVVGLIDRPAREVDVGNVSFVSKVLLRETKTYAISAGLGVTVPTASDVEIDTTVATRVFVPNAPQLSFDVLATYDGTYRNETVYLSPFLAWLMKPEDPQSRWFHQGFLQVEVAANPSTFDVIGEGIAGFNINGVQQSVVSYTTPGAVRVPLDVFAQTLLRANLGVGYQVSDKNRQKVISNVRALAEMHYTTTLQRANVSAIPIEATLLSGAFFPLGQQGEVGNADPRTDILNAALGVSADVGPFVITHGFVAPLRTGSDRGFDFEYNLQVLLPF